MRSTIAVAAAIAAMAAGTLGGCATNAARLQASSGGRLAALEQQALARQRAVIVPASGMLPVDDVVGLTVVRVAVAKSLGVEGAALTADQGQELVVISYRLTNVTPQGQPLPDGQRLLLVDPQGRIHQPDAGRTARLAAACAACAKAGAQVAPDAPAQAVAVFQLPAGSFNARTWLASWLEEDAEKIRFPGARTLSSSAPLAPADRAAANAWAD